MAMQSGDDENNEVRYNIDDPPTPTFAALTREDIGNIALDFFRFELQNSAAFRAMVKEALARPLSDEPHADT